MKFKASAPQIKKRPEFAKLANGLFVKWPQSYDYREAERLTREQEQLYDEMCRLPNSEEGHGRAASIKRLVAAKENQKHPCLRVWNAHLFPEEARKIGLVV